MAFPEELAKDLETPLRDDLLRRVQCGEAIVRVHSGPGCCVHIHAYVIAKAPRENVWDVLTDYENLPRIVPGMLESRLLGRQDGDLLVRQTARVADVLDLSAAVTLAVREEPPDRIKFRCVGGDLKRMDGSWRLVDNHGNGVLVAYGVLLQPSVWVPCWIVKRRLHEDVPKQLHALASEAERRSSAQAAGSGST
ncbi:MAG: SRPBCC family protein [Armatimonadota bacterium]